MKSKAWHSTSGLTITTSSDCDKKQYTLHICQIKYFVNLEQQN